MSDEGSSGAGAAGEKKYDVVVWGATGYTGGLVVDYFAKHYDMGVDSHLDKTFTWAIAGRNEDALKKIRSELAKKYENQEFESLDILVATAEAPEKLATSSKVVLSCVGPFIQYGSPLVACCLAAHTHYVDITGESLWVRSLIDRHYDAARASGTLLVPMCGFDSVPSDLGAFHAAETLWDRHQLRMRRVTAYVEGVDSSHDAPTAPQPWHRRLSPFSGGTLATMEHFLALPPADQARFHDPYLLNDAKDPYGLVRYGDGDAFPVPLPDFEAAAWVAPFVMATANTRCVRRSIELISRRDDSRMARGCQYNEYYADRSLVRLVVGYMLPLLLLVVVLSVGMIKRRLQPYLPKPGDAPHVSDEVTFRYYAVAENGLRSLTMLEGVSGYRDTAVFVAEAALCAALERETLPEEGGVLTPAAAFGKTYVRRLEKRGIVFRNVGSVEKAWYESQE